MAHPGPAQKNVKHGRTPTADWTDVVDEPYTGPSPDLPPLGRGKKWNPLVTDWWEEVRVMPHCRLWGPTDWRFATETALLKQALWRDYNAGTMKGTMATDVRRREGMMGTTLEARRQLRIRYVPTGTPVEDTSTDEGDEAVTTTAGVTSLHDRRRRLTG